MDTQDPVDPKETERSHWRSRLADVEGRLARFILLAVQKQAIHDAEHVRKFVPPRKIEFFYGSIAMIITFIMHIVAITLYLYTTVDAYFLRLLPIRNVFDILFPKDVVSEPAMILTVLQALAYLTMATGLLLILTYVIWTLTILCGHVQSYSLMFGCTQVINIVFLMFTSAVAVFLQNHDAVAHSILGHIALHGIDGSNFNSFDAIQYELSCCGLNDKTDWLDDRLFNWTDPFSRRYFEINNRFEFHISCRSSEGYLCRVPNSCCADFEPRLALTEPLSCARSTYNAASFRAARLNIQDHLSSAELVHADGCAALLTRTLSLWWYGALTVLVVSLLVMVVGTVVSTAVISQVDGLGVVDALSESVIAASNLSLFKVSDGLNAVGTRIKLNDNQKDHMRNEGEVIKAAVKGKRHHLLDPDSSNDSMIDLPEDKIGLFSVDI